MEAMERLPVMMIAKPVSLSVIVNRMMSTMVILRPFSAVRSTTIMVDGWGSQKSIQYSRVKPHHLNISESL